MPPLPPAPANAGADNKDAAPKAPLAPKKVTSFEVKALRPGFYKGQRIAENDTVQIAAMSEAGDWMEATDPVVQKQLEAHLLSEKKRKAASADD